MSARQGYFRFLEVFSENSDNYPLANILETTCVDETRVIMNDLDENLGDPALVVYDGEDYHVFTAKEIAGRKAGFEYEGREIGIDAFSGPVYIADPGSAESSLSIEDHGGVIGYGYVDEVIIPADTSVEDADLNIANSEYMVVEKS